MTPPRRVWTFREVTDRDDLEACFRLRYRAFRSSPLRCLVPHNPVDSIDLQPWDEDARHYAVFDPSGRVIACGRAAGVGSSTPTEAVAAMRARCAPPAGPYALRGRFPLLGLWPENEMDPSIRSRLGEPTTFEPGRICTAPNLGTASPRAYRLLVEAGLVSEMGIHRREFALAMAPMYLVPAYEALGFTVAQVRSTPVVGGYFTSALMCLDRERFRSRMGAERWSRWIDQLAETGRVELPAPAAPPMPTNLTATEAL